jgi:DNA modification methylase
VTATWQILEGDCRASLAGLPAASVQTCVTSPPYFGLRDYGHDGQIGLEPSPDEFVAALVEVFREVRRVLRDDGTVWLNLGDSYAGSWGNQGRKADRGTQRPINGGMLTPVADGRYPDAGSNTGRIPAGADYKAKDLLGIPWMVAFALRQPWERRIIQAATDRAWLAGLVDGEGCVSVVAVHPTTGINESHSMRLQIRMADVEAVERTVAITGLSNVSYDQTTAEGCRPAQQWKISGDKAADVLADIYPYLTVKRRQAIVGWNLQRLKDGVVTKRGQPIPAENMAKRRLLHEVLRKLNQREPVDIPSWCREPEVETEPGWYLRADVIWAKPNPMPESVTDRPTKAHEYLFLLSKRPRYFYDADAIREIAVVHDRPEGIIKPGGEYEALSGRNDGDWPRSTTRGFGAADAGRNRRSVWTVATQPFPGAHFATFPPKLIEPCILAGTSPQACGVCGAPWERVVERTKAIVEPSERRALMRETQGDRARTNLAGTMTQAPSSRTVGWRPGCEHDDDTGSCVVLDPFSGAGTTGMVALRHGRSYLGCELSPEYVRLSRDRIINDAPLLNTHAEAA